MTLIYTKRLGDNVPHEIMSYHSWRAVTDMTDYIVRTDMDDETTPVFGLEIECSKGEDEITQSDLDELFEIFPFMQWESDGSIPGCSGCTGECITPPMTINAYIEAGFEGMLNKAQELGFKAFAVTSRDTGSGCGGHIHINKRDGWEKVVALMAMFIDQNKEIMQIICKRPFTDYARNNLKGLGNSMKRYSLEYVEKYMQSNSGDHSNIINLQHSASIEFRLPVGTLDYETKMAHIELLNNLYQCCEDVINGRARIDRLTINKVCKDGNFLPKLMDELCISCSKKLIVIDKMIKQKVNDFNVDKCKLIKALSDLQLALATTNDTTIPQGSINTINTHFINISGASNVDDAVFYVKNITKQRVISRGLQEYADTHNNSIAKYYTKLKQVCREIDVPTIYEDMKGEK